MSSGRSPREIALWWVLGAGLLGITLFSASSVFRSRPAVLESLGAAPAFQLMDQESRPVSRESLAGHVWVADFMFTRCRGICPILGGRLMHLQGELRGLEGWRFVSFSVDSEYDTQQVLAEYADNLGADGGRWHFLTGPADEVKRVVIEGFHLAIEPGQEDSEEPILHSRRIILIDHAGEIRGYYDALDQDAMKRLTHDFKQLLENAS